MKSVLVTGGTGYIGSHCIVELVKSRFKCIVVDNLSNSKTICLNRVRAILDSDNSANGVALDDAILFYQIDLAIDRDQLEDIFKKHNFYCVLHLAGSKSVSESVSQPLKYYHNNLIGTINLLQVMDRHQIYKLVFSSSATVYGDPEKVPTTEDCRIGNCKNPYGWSKYFIEQMLMDLVASSTDNKSWKVVSLRYFNPIGNHDSGLIGEDPAGIPANLIPYVARVAAGKLEIINIFGDDYDTPDGTGVRDYIHVVDLAKGHLAAINYLEKSTPTRGNGLYRAFNIGTGVGYSVLEIIKMFEKIANRTIPYRIVARREGDIAKIVTDVTLAKTELDWSANYDLETMCKDCWKWQCLNPVGYEESQ